MDNTIVKFTIPLPPITKKNSQRIVNRGGRPMILPSEKYKEYEESALWFIPRREALSSTAKGLPTFPLIR